MKKIFVLIALMCSIIFAASPGAVTIYGPVYCEVEYGPARYTLADSLHNVDTLSFLSKYHLKNMKLGCDYFTNFYVDSVGSGDSLKVVINVYDPTETYKIYSASVDTVAPSTNYVTTAITGYLDGSTSYGNVIDIKLIQMNNNGMTSPRVGQLVKRVSTIK
jgi:hypothetical protein